MKPASLLLSYLFLAGCTPAGDMNPDGFTPDLSGSAADLGAPVLRGGTLRMPVEAPDKIDPSIILGMDHLAVPSKERTQCQSYAGLAFPFCYAGHQGTDFILEGGFKAMDAGSAWIVAARAGRVVEVEDGHYDRCHASAALGDVSCDGYEMKSNHVVIEHEDLAGPPLRTEYHHMMKGSIVVTVGMQVTCGQRIGRIGSSGRSSLPHVHLNVLRGGQPVDPYAGPYSQPQTLWIEQNPDHTVLPPAVCLP